MKTLAIFVRMTPTLLTLLILGSHAVFAGVQITGITDTALASVTKFVQAIAGLAAVGLLGLAVWEFAGHRQLSKAAWELVGVVIAGLISIHASDVAAALNLNGATL
ncbi:MAG TPA: hypothetical protein VGZ00_04085 [Candidatus Baltobacteraceae bacterium]|jgi:hypothetical protein|nr:hypothetical protein [Candidatus Baltobacteraceae bacterium]